MGHALARSVQALHSLLMPGVSSGVGETCEHGYCVDYRYRKPKAAMDEETLLEAMMRDTAQAVVLDTDDVVGVETESESGARSYACVLAAL